MAAFWALNADRSLGMGGAGPISFLAIDAYARRYGIGTDDIDEFELFRTVIKALDSAYLEKKHTPQTEDGKDIVEVDPNDPNAVKALLQRRAAAKTG